MTRFTKSEEFKVEVVEWASRPGTFGPAVVRRDTGEIANGPWIDGTSVAVVDMPYRADGECAAAAITTPDGEQHYSYLFA